jgi:F0F1-type ATP synthase membrane subunit b/b'
MSWRILALASIFLLLGCSGQRIISDAETSVTRVIDRTETLVKETKDSVSDTLEKAKKEYKEALAETKDSVSDIRAEVAQDISDVQDRLLKQIEDADRRMEERINQIRQSFSETIAQSDRAVQARIDQIFLELRSFIKETLQQIKELIQPILTLATKLGDSLEHVNKVVDTVSERTTALINAVTDVIKEGKILLLKFQGKEEQGNKQPMDWAAILGVLAGLGAALKSFLTDRARSKEKAEEGLRWKPEEIDERVILAISQGKLDQAIKERIALLKEPPSG